MSIGALAAVTGILLAVLAGVATLSNNFLSTILDPDTLDSWVSTLGSKRSDVAIDLKQLAAKYGHPAEDYVFYTEDGYRLKTFHLPGSKCGIPILLFHGVVDSADTWVLRGNDSLAITLANANYDVWLGNVRGNKYSQGNTPLSLDLNATYWNFTFHEHGVYDLPATIDLVLKKTGAPKLNLIVHSQGTTISFVLLSSKPEYNNKVNLLITLAPVAYLQHSPPPLGIVLRLLPEIYETLKAARQYQLFTETSPTLALVRKACSTAAAAFTVCLNGVVYQYAGYDITEIDPAFSDFAFKHAPTATSSINLLHFGQVAIRQKFARFDYGPAGNKIAYNSVEPPLYALENVTTKVVLLTARNDFFSTQSDVALLRAQLPNVVKFVVNPRVQMNHLDYVWGKNAKKYLFPYIFESLKTYGEEY